MLLLASFLTKGKIILKLITLVSVIAVIALAPSPFKKIDKTALAHQNQQTQTAVQEAPQLAQTVADVEAPKAPFNPQDKSTWPTCAPGEIVRADNGQCSKAPTPPPAPVAPAARTAKTTGGNCDSWKAAAGIPNTHATNKLINNESGCRTNAINPSSGACGIPQAYPCSKLPCPLNDSGAVCQLKWMDNYVKRTYGTWENALAKWHSRCGSKQGCWY